MSFTNSQPGFYHINFKVAFATFFLMCLLSIVPGMARADATALFDANLLDEKQLIAGDSTGVGLDAKRDQGMPWVFYFYVAKNNDAGESRFEAMPDGIGVNVMDAQFHFSNKSMTKGNPTQTLNKLQQFIDDRVDQSAAVDSLPDLSEYKLDELSYQSFLKSYPYEELLKGPAGIGIHMVKAENATPVVLYAISGQGDVPEALKQIIKDSNGSWYGRYRYIIWSLLGAALAIFVFFRVVKRQ